MFKLCVLAIVLSVAAMASVNGAVPVYRYSYPPYYPNFGMGLVPTVPLVESKTAEGKIDGIAPISSYLIDPLYSSYYYGYPYVGYPYAPGLRFVRDADKNTEHIEEPVEEQSGEVRDKRSPQVVPAGNFNTQRPH